MAGVTGLEPAASAVTGRRSNQLSYTPDAWKERPAREGLDVIQHPRQVKERGAHTAIADLARADKW